MKYLKIYEEFKKPFNSFNPYVNEIMKGLDSIYVKDNVVSGVIHKNSGKLDRVTDPQFFTQMSYRMMVQVKYIEQEPKIEIMIYWTMVKQVEYLKHLCDIYCQNKSSLNKFNFEVYYLSLDKFDDFIKDLTIEGEKMWKDTKKYNI
jgi:hypothetical protein